MPIRVMEIHHHTIRIDGSEVDLQSNLGFYQGLLGLQPDSGRPLLPGIPGFWINVGGIGQIHLIGGEQPSRPSKGPDKDPVVPHVALAVPDIAEAKAKLELRGVPYWSLMGVAGPQAEQIFLRDTNANLIELHRVDQC